MAHPLRWFLPGVVYEVTTRTLQERFLLRPSVEICALILGILARAQRLYNVRIYAFAYLSNHAHLLISADVHEQFTGFMAYVNGLIARKIGRRNGWRGRFWARRARPIPILDDVKLVERFKYVLAQGVKEGLVNTVLEWPGASSSPGLLRDMKLCGKWVNENDLRNARRSRRDASEAEYTTSPELELSPLPCWADLDADALRTRHQQMVCEVEEEARVARRGMPALGVAKVLATHPFEIPRESEHRAAPQCHTASPTIRERYARMYRAVVEAYREASRKTRENYQRIAEGARPSPDTWPVFPAGTIPRRGWPVRADRRALIDVVLDLLPRKSQAPLPI